MLITAFWGVWHLVSGLTLSQIWARRPVPGSDLDPDPETAKPKS